MRTLGRLNGPAWPPVAELRIGLGCMRLSTDEDRDDDRALETIAAAAASGITLFDTARAYGRGPDELGHNERLLGRALRACAADRTARIVTKGGMSRPDGAWIPDGRARTIRADCEASLVALDGIAIDLYLVHAPDPRTPWRTTVRALARAADEGLVAHVGVANVNRGQLDEALEHAPITAVQVALNPFDDRALRGGVLERCEEAGVALIAHSPLGGARRVGALARREPIPDLSAAHDATPAEVALAWLLDLSPAVVAIPGARRPETARSAARAARLELDVLERTRLAESLGGRRPRFVGRPPRADDAEVVLVMGIPGAGKTRVAEDYVALGYERLNRDERGGSLAELADALDDALQSGDRRVVLDNTYLTRASRSHVIEAAARHGTRARCVWVDTPLAQAQVNLVERMLDRLDALPSTDELKRLARREPGIMAPTSQMRALRELEPPSADEGFAAVEHVHFERAAGAHEAGGVFVAASVLVADGWSGSIRSAEPAAPHLVFDWRPDGAVDDLADEVGWLAAVVSGPVVAAVCPHGGGAPVCWCRPPLPGLPLAFAHAHGIDPGRSVLVGTSTAHRTLATTLGARFVEVRRG
jgi:aryl-alcohol dehydrogenase-like predicted oxidoreductase/predicted kinase